MDPLIVVFGMGVGVLVGLTGIGGGSVLTPLLILVVGTQPVTAIGTDLAYGAITKTVGGWRHQRQRNVDLALALWLAVGSAPGSLLGVWAVERVHEAEGGGVDRSLLIGIGLALTVAACAVLVRGLLAPATFSRERESADLGRRGRSVAVAVGLALGFVLGFTSVGSGALIGLVLIFTFKLTPRRVVGTDVFHAAILLWVAGIAHLASGNVDLGLMSNLLLGSIPGVLIGASLVRRVPVAGLRPALGVVLLAAALGVFSKAGVAVPPLAVAGVPATVALGLVAIYRRQRRRALATSS